MPYGGNLVILFAPHVGVTPEGNFGKFARDGQDFNDDACGAAVNSFRWLQQNQWEPQPDKNAPVVVPAGTDTFEYQAVYIREALKPYFNQIQEAEEPMAELAFSMYEITQKYVEGIVEAIPNVKVSILGGI